MRGEKYLTRKYRKKGGTPYWYAQMAVPADLIKRKVEFLVQGKLRPVKVFTAYLGAVSRTEASKEAVKHTRAWEAMIAAAQSNAALSAEEIERIGQAERTRVAAILSGEPTEIDDGHNESADRLTMILNEYGDDLRAGDYRLIWNQLTAELAKRGDVLAPYVTRLDDDLNYSGMQPELTTQQRELADTLMRATIAGLDHAIKSHEGEPAPTTGRLNAAATSFKPPPIRRGKSIPISQAAVEYVATSGKHWTNQTKSQHEFAFRMFASMLGDCPIDAVTADDAFKFLDDYSKIKATFGRSSKAADMSFADILREYPATSQGPGPTSRSIERNVSHLRGLFRWAAHPRRKLHDGPNPFVNIIEGSGERKGKGRTSYDELRPGELTKLFHSGLLKTTTYKDRVTPVQHDMETALMWLPLIALFGGEREEEIAQLRVDDVKSEKVKARTRKSIIVDYLNLTADHDEQSLKTEAAERKVPVHPELIRCGFLEYVAHVKKQGHEWLFPGLEPSGPDKKRSAAFVKAFGRYRGKLGIERRDKITGKNVIVFHSLRKNFTTACENGMVAESDAARAVGHEIKSLTYGLYSKGLRLDRLKAVVEAVEYPDLDLRHLHASRKAKR